MFVIECDFGENTKAYRDGKKFYVDADDYDKFVDGYSFYSNHGYVHYSSCKDGLNSKILHRLIMGEPEGMDVDHIDGDSLNNRKSNLRICTHQQNGMNQKIRNTNKSGVKGVSRDNHRNMWRADICVDGKNLSLGRFKNFDEAVRVRKEAEIKYFGEFNRST